MASDSTTKPHPSLPFPEYFTQLASNYPRHTGNTTRTLFQSALTSISLPSLTSPSVVIHDNAAGPGTATSVIVEQHFQQDADPKSNPKILITDSVPAMIAQASSIFPLETYPTISTHVLDSHNLLPLIPDDSVTLSILNFSIFTFLNPRKCLEEIHRSLTSSGKAIILTWCRFGPGLVVHAAQQKVRPDLPVMKIPGAEFMQEGYLASMVNEVFFSGDENKKMQVIKVRHVVTDKEDLDGLKDFMLGKFTDVARKGWSEEEVKKWPEAVEEALKEEAESQGGGVGAEAWAVTVEK